MNHYGYLAGFQPGDVLYLEGVLGIKQFFSFFLKKLPTTLFFLGNFQAQNLFFSLHFSTLGNATIPFRITSLDPLQPATITVSSLSSSFSYSPVTTISSPSPFSFSSSSLQDNPQDGIFIYCLSSEGSCKGFNIQIDHIRIVYNASSTPFVPKNSVPIIESPPDFTSSPFLFPPKPKVHYGIHIYHESFSEEKKKLDGLVIENVNVEGDFTKPIKVYKKMKNSHKKKEEEEKKEVLKPSDFISNLSIKDSNFAL